MLVIASLAALRHRLDAQPCPSPESKDWSTKAAAALTGLYGRPAPPPRRGQQPIFSDAFRQTFV